MKEKPKSQTTQNTYRFQTFSERIANININVVHRIAIQSEVPEEGDTFLAEGLIKWSELNFTDDFDAFKNDLPEVETLKQLVLNENEVIELLVKHLQNEKSLALQPILELVIAVAKDLQIDFYPHYSKFFNIILKLVNTKDVDVIEWAFTTLSYLFKFLWRYMIKDIEEVFTIYLPFLNKKQPQHIQNFAAESFAFLIRKVPDKEKLLDFIFTQLENNPNHCNGFGQLLYEVLKGVQQQFHSSIELIMPLILKKLRSEIVLDCQLQMALSMASYTSQKFMSPVWNVFNKFIKSLVLEGEKSRVVCHEHLLNVLRLWQAFLTHEGGKLIVDVQHITEVLEWLLSKSEFTSNCADSILELVSFCLLNLSSKLEISHITRIITMVFKSLYYYKSKLTFVRFMFHYGMFEKDVLLPFINFSQSCLTDQTRADILLLFTQIIFEFRPTPQNGDQFNTWQRYNLDFKNAEKISSTIIHFMNLDVEDIYADLPMLLSVLILLPHVRPLDLKYIKTKLKILRVNIYSLPEKCDIPFVFNQLVTCQILLEKYEDTFFESFDEGALIQLIQLLGSCPKNAFILRTVDIVLTLAKIHKKGCCDEIENLFPQLQYNLKSPHQEVRLLTLRIFSTFNLKLPCVAVDNTQQTNVFLICLAAEQIDPNIHTYRERLKLLQKLDWELVQSYIPDGNYEHVPLLYLIGSLFVNFKLLWGPICKLIESYARGMKSELFWEIFLSVLTEDSNIIVAEKGKNLRVERVAHEHTDIKLFDQLDLVYRKFLTVKNDRSDYINHRELLWNTMSSFNDIAEQKNRAIVPFLFQFLHEEYYRLDFSAAPSQDLRRKNLDETDNDMDIDEPEMEFENDVIVETETENPDGDFDSILEDEQTETSKKRKNFTIRKTNRRSSKQGNVIKTLCSYLSVIAKFHNPKAVYREQELREVMETLLTHRNSKIQNYALDFIISYNDNAINKYQTKLYNLLSDKTIKGVLTKFNIDVECKVIDDGDREKVLPVVLRILFGRMSASIGKNTSGKKNSTKRRAIVMRFLAGAQESELKMFLELAFQPFLKYTKDEAVKMVTKIITSIDPSAVLPLKKIQWSLDLLGIAFSKIGNLMAKHLPWLLKLILSMLTILNQLLERRDELHPKFINPLKHLRSLALMELVKFFELFDTYPFSTLEIEAIFQAAVWPQLKRLHYESIYTPTALLRLFQVWSSNPRYFSLLAKCDLNDDNLSPLSKLMELLVSVKTRPVVVRFILAMLESIFSLADCNPEIPVDGEGPTIEVLHTYEVDRSRFVNENESPNFGTLILLPHITAIFSRLKTIVKRLSAKKTKQVPESVLTILLRASEHLTEPQQCNEMADLLFPFLAKRGINSEVVEITILQTIGMISKYMTDPKRFVKTIALLFSCLSKRASRLELCELLKVIARRCPEYESISLIVAKLNAWDARRVEEPNYLERLEGFRNAIEKIPEMISSNNMDFALLAIYNSFYMIRNSGDVSLLDSSTHFLCQLSTHFKTSEGKQKDIYIDLLHNVYLPEIKTGLKSKLENVRHEFIIILASVLRSSCDIPKLKDLCALLSDDTDVDFFQNIRHIQMHRRARAMIRLAKGGQLASFQEDILTQFLMPIATSFLLSDVYTKHTFLIDAGVELVGAICRVLSWYRYEMILKHYLFLLPKNGENQKIVVRLIVAILEAFHFDLTMSEGIKCNLKPPPTKAAKKKNRKTEDEDDNENNDVDEDVAMDVDVIEKMEEQIPVETQKKTKESTFATKIHNQVIKGILPQLNRCLTKRTKSDDQHKLVKDSFPEDEEILRVPIALAIVKMLQNLPKGSLEQHLPGLFLKLCVFLKSRSLTIRTTTREVLVKIVNSIGPSYFPYLVKQMKQTMTKGYQVHVMIFSIHTVLHNLIDRLSVGDLDVCLKTLLDVCNNELFGEVSEEKEVEEIVGKLKEARGCKSYNLYEIMARFVSASHLLDLVQPLKEVLLTTHKHQVVHKVKECLRSVVLGLSENENLEIKSFLIFAHGLMNENILTLHGIKKKAEKKLPSHLQRPDSYLLPEEPKRTGLAKTSIKTNSYILIEFGLQLVYFYLKKGKLVPTEITHIQLLDPFISHFIECLSSVHAKIVATTLRCVLALMKFQLPSLKKNINSLAAAIFVILNKHGSAGAQGENFDMVVVCFKLMSVMLRDIRYFKIKPDHLKVLLTFAEQDIMDHTRQATAFSLLKAVLKRRLVDAQVNEIMLKVAEMSVASETDHIRVQCRQVFHQYLFDYPIGKKIKKHIEFYTSQLLFQHEYGRNSALLMLQSMITSFPIKLLQQYYIVIFIPLSACLVNDDSAVCRKMAGAALNSLLKHVEHDQREYLFSIVVEWLQDSKTRHRRLAAQICGIFVEVEKENFKNRIQSLLPVFINQLDPEKHGFTDEDKVARTSDHLILHILNSILKMVNECGLLVCADWQDEMCLLWEYVEQHLVHPHDLVRLVSCQLVGLLFSHHSVDELVDSITNIKESSYYLLQDTSTKLQKFSFNLISQVQSEVFPANLQDQVIKNLAYIAKIARALEIRRMVIDATEIDENKLKVDWLIGKMVRECKFEVALEQQSTLKRSCIFKWLAAVAINLGSDGLNKERLSLILSPLQREINDSSPQSDAELKSLAQEVIELVKPLVEQALFAQCYAELQVSTSRKRAKRKADRDQEVVANPEVAAKKRIKRQKSKTESKRRRIEKLRPMKIKKNSLKDLAFVS